jgi:16S rRNA G527 N7-methylase RsmG
VEKNVDIWEEDEVYCKTVRALRVLSGTAEWGAALMEEYDKYLLLVVKQYRQKYPDTKTHTLLS